MPAAVRCPCIATSVRNDFRRPRVGLRQPARRQDDRTLIRTSALTKQTMNQPQSLKQEVCGGPPDCVPRPKVSVLLMTYNHERFIGQAIESVLAQETDFPFELVIGEDCSTDGTRRICESFAASDPERVRLLPSPRNLGLLANYMRTWEACRGDFIATVDGDDFWLSPEKLATQVSALESNPRLSMCF